MPGIFISLSVVARCFGIVIAFCAVCTFAQGQEARFDKNDPGLTFTFSIHSGDKPSRFELELDKQGFVSGISVFTTDQSKPIQTIPSCGAGDENYAEFGRETEDPVLKHADLNFDGFEDLELLYRSIPHLGKKLYCVYLWDSKAGRFRYSQEVTNIATNLEVQPATKTLTTHEDWMFGPWQDSTYRWRAGKLELIEQTSLLGSWSEPVGGRKGCGFTYTCSRLIGGKMKDTLTKPICKPEEIDDLPACPSTQSHNSGQPALIDPFRVD